MAKVGEIDLDGSGFNATLKKCNENFEHFGKSLKDALPILATLGIAFEAVMKVSEAFSETLEMGATLRDLSLSTGASVHDLVILQHAFDLAGVGADQAQSFIFKLQQAMAGVNEEGKSTATALDALGLSQDQLRNLPLLDQVAALQKGLAGIADHSDKAQALGNLFGKRQGAQYERLLADPNVLATAQQQAGPTADAFEKNVDKFKELDDAIKNLKVNFEGFFVGALQGFAPGVSDIANAFAKIDFVGIGESFGEIAKAFTDCAVALVPLINKVAELSKEMADLKPGQMIGGFAGSLVGLGGLGSWIGHLFDSPPKIENKKPGFADAFRGLQSASFNDDRGVVSSLQKVGGGGNFGGGDLTSEARRQTQLLQKIHDKLPGPSHTHHPHTELPIQ